MGSAIVHTGAVVICSHGGQAMPVVTSARVLAGGMPVVAVGEPYVVAGCGYVPPVGNGPCVIGEWVTGATRVRVEGRAVAVADGASVCLPTKTPMVVTGVQTRVVTSP
jgi:hypothetical protein